jgi:hypothetical protein
MSYPPALQEMLELYEQDPIGYFNAMELDEYSYLVWQWLAFLLTRLNQNGQDTEEDRHFTPIWHGKIGDAHNNINHQPSLDPNPRNVARGFVQDLMEFRQKKHPYFVMPNLALLDDDELAPEPDNPAPTAFHIGWGLNS